MHPRTCDRTIDLRALSSGRHFGTWESKQLQLANTSERGNENSNFESAARSPPSGPATTYSFSFIPAIRDLNYLSVGHLFIGRTRERSTSGRKELFSQSMAGIIKRRDLALALTDA